MDDKLRFKLMVVLTKFYVTYLFERAEGKATDWTSRLNSRGILVVDKRGEGYVSLKNNSFGFSVPSPSGYISIPDDVAEKMLFFGELA